MPHTSPQWIRGSFPSQGLDTDWIGIAADMLNTGTRLGPAANADVLSGHPFLHISWPFVNWAHQVLTENWQSLSTRYGSLPFDPAEMTSSLLRALSGQLVERSFRTLALELNVARLRNELQGETPELRLQSFATTYLINTENLLRLFDEYPVLLRVLCTISKNWVKNTTNAVTRLLEDLPQLTPLLGPSPGRLLEIRGENSDPHRGGQGVLMFIFEKKKLVYKPTSLKTTVLFQDLLSWLNEQGATPGFPLLQLVDRGPYGWEEFVERKPCTTLGEVQRFYRRQGGYLALLYLLDAADLHRENLIASGEFPVLVDLEALFHRQVVQELPATSAYIKAAKALNASVMRTGLLPLLLAGGQTAAAADVSGLGGGEGQSAPTAVLQVQALRSDQMHLVRQHPLLGESNNRPTLDGRPQNAEEFRDDLIEGFRSTYDLIAAHCEAFTAHALRYANVAVRQIIRPTWLYSLILEESCHPDFLRDGQDREQLLDRLWLGVPENLKAAVAFERRDLLHGDVPFFTTTPLSLDIWDSHGQQIPGYFSRDDLSVVLARIQSMSQADCAQQVRYIWSSVGSGGNVHELRANRTKLPEAAEGAADPGEFVAAAKSIGERLLADAIWGNDGQDVSWVGVYVNFYDQWQLAPVNESLYLGLTGIALFFAYLSEGTGELRYKQVAQAAMRSVDVALKENPEQRTVSVFNGLSSHIYTMTHLGVLWNDSRLLDRALGFADQVGALVPGDTALDLLNGVAGAIVGLLRLYRATGRKRVLEIATACGEHLLDKAIQFPHGHGWISTAKHPLTGLSHGAAGIAWPLAELAAATGDQRFHDIALSAIRLERAHFSQDYQNWLDLRSDPPRVDLAVWCNGAAGIGLARLYSLGHLADDQLEQEIRVAIETTRRVGWGYSHCWCHGDLGNIEFLLSAAVQLRDSALRQEAMQRAAGVMRSVSAGQSWHCGFANGAETPALWVGLAGIGYSFLRASDPERFPALIALEGPQMITNRGT